jgi:uncharacterized caspase-like protein
MEIKECNRRDVCKKKLMQSRALLVGINHYPESPLRGCINDAIAVEELLSKNEDQSPNFFCRRLTSNDHKVTLPELRRHVNDLFKDDADRVLFYFSGHGYENNLGGYLVTHDAKNYAEGMALSELIALANSALRSKRIREVILILDCCHAGYLGSITGFDHIQAVLMPGLSILTSSSPSQYSVETAKGGLFTSILCEGLRGGAADILGRITVAGLYNYLDQMLNPWQQRPQFKTYAEKMHVLRIGKARVSPQEIKAITKLFLAPSHKFRMNETFEYTSSNAIPEKVKLFDQLKKFRDAGLVTVPEPLNDLYWAAMKNGYAELTLSGQLYWKMVDKGMI